jgi:hypothetical protein
MVKSYLVEAIKAEIRMFKACSYINNICVYFLQYKSAFAKKSSSYFLTGFNYMNIMLA